MNILLTKLKLRLFVSVLMHSMLTFPILMRILSWFANAQSLDSVKNGNARPITSHLTLIQFSTISLKDLTFPTSFANYGLEMPNTAMIYEQMNNLRGPPCAHMIENCLWKEQAQPMIDMAND